MRLVDHSATFKAHLGKRCEQMLAQVARGAVSGIKTSMANASGGKNPPPGENPRYGWLRQRGRAGGPPARQTGKLLESISWVRIAWDRVRVGTGLKVGRYQQYGRKAGGWIRPKTFPALAFRSKWGNLVYFAKVKQTAVPARPWLPTRERLTELVLRSLGR